MQGVSGKGRIYNGMQRGEIMKEKGQHGLGKLTIFFSYAPGTGKSRVMLEAAAEEKARGTDVVIGYLENRPGEEKETRTREIERLSLREIRYQGQRYQEFDLDGALARNPELVLVDEMAHVNREGSRHLKRYQDIEELLRAGIDVYTTVNVQNLESLKDIVFSATEDTVSEQIPDSVFDRADQIRFVDMDPEELLRRDAERNSGKETADIFTQEKLNALREIAFRRAADGIGKRIEEKKKKVREHLLICLSGAPSNAAVIRAAARMAEAFHGKLTALYVETAAEKNETLRKNLRIARDLGAQIATVYGEDTALQIAEYAQISGVTKIVMGRSAQHGRARQMVDRIGELAPDVEIYIIPDYHRGKERPGFFREDREKLTWKETAAALGIIAACTGVCFFFSDYGFRESNLILIYILGILGVSMITGSKMYSLGVSVLSVLVFNFFFTEPRFTMVSAPEYLMTLVMMLATAVVSSMMTGSVKKQAVLSARKAYRTGTLLETSRKLQQAGNEKEILSVAAVQLGKLLESTIAIYPADEKGELGDPEIYPAIEKRYGKNTESRRKDPVSEKAGEVFAEEKKIAEWVFHNNRHAGAMTDTFSEARCLYLAVRGKNRALAAAGILTEKCENLPEFEKDLMVAILDECGFALEREQIRQAKQQLEETARQEALRANLLRSISHDLRTPLTAISGNAGILMRNSGQLEEKKKQNLYLTIYDDAMWLIRLVENLLSITRIENGSMKLQLRTGILEEVIYEALGHLDRKASEHKITVSMPEEILAAEMDSRLIAQVVVNIVNNAVKYTQPGSEIRLSAERQGEFLAVRISDNGPGIQEEERKRIFDMFYTAEHSNADGRRGLGLGLALCRAIISAHGGMISADACEPCGTCFTFTLRASEVAAYE